MASLEELIAILKKEKEDTNTTYTQPWKAVLMAVFILLFAFFYKSNQIRETATEGKVKILYKDEEARTVIDEIKMSWYKNLLQVTKKIDKIKKDIYMDKYHEVEKQITQFITQPKILIAGESYSEVNYLDKTIKKQGNDKVSKSKKRVPEKKANIHAVPNNLLSQKPKNIAPQRNMKQKTEKLAKTSIKKNLERDLKKNEQRLAGMSSKKELLKKAIKNNIEEHINNKSKLDQLEILKKVKKLPPPYNVLMIGDSMMGGYIGLYIEGRITKKTKGRCVIKGVRSSGLALPKYFNWNQKLKKLINKHKPNILVVMMGTNDFHLLYSLEKKKYFRFGTKEWKLEYKKATQRIMKRAQEKGILTFWLGLPLTEKTKLNRHIEKINAIYKDMAKSYPNVHYISLWHLFGKGPKKVQKFIKNKRGYKIRIRARDGIHLGSTAAKKAGLYVLQIMAKYIVFS